MLLLYDLFNNYIQLYDNNVIITDSLNEISLNFSIINSAVKNETLHFATMLFGPHEEENKINRDAKFDVE